MCGYFCIGKDFMLAGKKLTDYINLFSPHDLKKTIIQLRLISKMNKSNSIKYNSLETIDKKVLS